MFFYPVVKNEVSSFQRYLSEDITTPTTTDDSEASPLDMNASFFDDNDNEPFDMNEWMIQDKVTSKRRPAKLCEFLRLLLDNPRYASYTSWTNKNSGEFKIHKPIQVAYLWKKLKVRRTNGLLNYDTFARGIRYYYKSGVMLKTHARHTYRFGQM